MPLRDYRLVPPVFSTANPFPILLICATIYTLAVYFTAFTGDPPLVSQLQDAEAFIMLYLLFQGTAFAFAGYVHSAIGLTLDYVSLAGLTDADDDRTPEVPDSEPTASEKAGREAVTNTSYEADATTDDTPDEPTDDEGSAYDLIQEATDGLTQPAEAADADTESTTEADDSADTENTGRTVTVPDTGSVKVRALGTATPLTEYASIYLAGFLLLSVSTLFVSLAAGLPNLFFITMLVTAATGIAGWRSGALSRKRMAFSRGFNYDNLRATITPLSYQLWRAYLVVSAPLLFIAFNVIGSPVSRWWATLAAVGSLTPTAVLVVASVGNWKKSSLRLGGLVGIFGMFSFGFPSSFLSLAAYLGAPYTAPDEYRPEVDGTTDDTTPPMNDADTDTGTDSPTAETEDTDDTPDVDSEEEEAAEPLDPTKD